MQAVVEPKVGMADRVSGLRTAPAETRAHAEDPLNEDEMRLLDPVRAV